MSNTKPSKWAARYNNLGTENLMEASSREAYVAICGAGFGGSVVVWFSASLFQKSKVESWGPFDLGWYIPVTLLLMAVGAFACSRAFREMGKAGAKKASEIKEQESRIPCPVCAERIRPEAKMCPFCKTLR